MALGSLLLILTVCETSYDRTLQSAAAKTWRTQVCPPGAITPNKQTVRGVERWYVNFDQCIPYFAEAASCGICIAECPWTRPSVRPKLLTTMAQRIGKE
jgi:epoxyqueuosine reductase QueG